MTHREKIIKNYIEGYNQFDVEKMVNDFADYITFENIQDGETNMSMKGLAAFREQAEKSKAYFTRRTQTVKSFVHSETTTEIEVDYNATLGMDFPNGLKKGQDLNLAGRSIFEFNGNKIIKLTDIS
jgi:hypothetical protein